MSWALCCDQCGAVLPVNANGDAATGEEASWLTIVTTFESYDLCTRACATALLDSAEFVAAMDDGAQASAEIASVEESES